MGVGEWERDDEGEISVTIPSPSWYNVEWVAVRVRARSVRLRRKENRTLLRHRLTALLHFLCAALASRMLREASSSANSEE